MSLLACWCLAGIIHVEVCGGVLNAGYILHGCQKYLQEWDCSIERRAGGFDSCVTLAAQRFTLTNMSSLLCLIAEVVYLLKTTGACPEHLAKAFTSLRVTLYLLATPEDIVNLNAAENTEQFKRKQHSELDNISTVAYWQQQMGAHPQLCAAKALDVFKYALLVDDPRQLMPTWCAALMKNKAPTLKNKVLALADKAVTKRQLDALKAQPSHAQVSSYNAIALRVRFLKGFSQEARWRRCVVPGVLCVMSSFIAPLRHLASGVVRQST